MGVRDPAADSTLLPRLSALAISTSATWPEEEALRGGVPSGTSCAAAPRGTSCDRRAEWSPCGDVVPELLLGKASSWERFRTCEMDLPCCM